VLVGGSPRQSGVNEVASKLGSVRRLLSRALRFTASLDAPSQTFQAVQPPANAVACASPAGARRGSLQPLVTSGVPARVEGWVVGRSYWMC